jgi:hypothetical protein
LKPRASNPKGFGALFPFSGKKSQTNFTPENQRKPKETEARTNRKKR